MVRAQPTRAGCFLAVCIFSMFAAGLLWMLVHLAEDAHKASRALDWPTVQGTIISSQPAKGCGKYGASYYPRVRYEYRTGFTVYTGNRIDFGAHDCGSARGAKHETDRYVPGTEVTVHVNPADPFDAVLVPGIAKITWVFMIVMGGLAIVFFGTAIRHARIWWRMTGA